MIDESTVLTPERFALFLEEKTEPVAVFVLPDGSKRSSALLRLIQQHTVSPVVTVSDRNAHLIPVSRVPCMVLLKESEIVHREPFNLGAGITDILSLINIAASKGVDA